jgi:hypothetical protein
LDFFIEGFALERKDRSETRDKLGGGLTIYFSGLLNYQRRKDLEISNLESIWLTYTWSIMEYVDDVTLVGVNDL